jgi:hypothetical protein
VRCDLVGEEARAAAAALVSPQRRLWVGCPFAWADRVLAGGDSFGVDLSTVCSWLVASRVVVPGGAVAGLPGAAVLPPVGSFGASLRGLDDAVRRWVDEAVAEDLFWRGVSAGGLRVDRSQLARVLQRKQTEVDAFSRALGFDLLAVDAGRKAAAWLRSFGVVVVAGGTGFEDVDADAVDGSTVPPELWAVYVAAMRPKSQVWALRGFGKFLEPGDVVRPRYHINKASTGRMSANKPAIQNLTSEARCAVLAPEGRELWSVDHVSAEIAVLAAAINNPDLARRDIYRELANSMGCERKLAKFAALAWLYGQGAAARGVLLGSAELVTAFDVAVKDVLPDVVDFRRSLEARVSAGVQLHTLAARPLPLLSGAKKYKSLNLVIQGSARDAFAEAGRAVAAAGLGIHLEIPMHDEFLVSTPQGSDPVAVIAALTTAMAVTLPGGLVQMRSDVDFLGSRWGRRALETFRA